MAISKDGRRLEMNGTLIALVEDVQIRRSVEHLSGKHQKKKRDEKKCQFADNVTFSHMENIQTHYDSFFLRKTENNAQASFRSVKRKIFDLMNLRIFSVRSACIF